MPQYYFDIHADSLSTWDDDGTAACDAAGAIAHAKYLIVAKISDITRLGGDRRAIVSIRDTRGKPIATVTGTGSGDPWVMSTGPS